MRGGRALKSLWQGLHWLRLPFTAGVLGIALLAILAGQAVFSPGALNTHSSGVPLGDVLSHGDLSNRCNSCHAPPWGNETMADRCLTCHTQVAAELQQLDGLHPLFGADRSRGCTQGCHTEHKGAQAPITLATMRHPSQGNGGFSLEAHRAREDGSAFTCVDCHSVSLAVFEQNACDACHRESSHQLMATHVETFGSACLQCHDGIDSYGAAFDHNAAPFPLVEAHQAAPCSGCHLGARTIAELQSAPQDCNSCHSDDDVHQAGYGAACDQCHSASAWRPARYDRPHAFPLRHEGARSECAQCHPDTLLTYSCYAGCHEHSPAGMRREHREVSTANLSACAECHPRGD